MCFIFAFLLKTSLYISAINQSSVLFLKCKYPIPSLLLLLTGNQSLNDTRLIQSWSSILEYLKNWSKYSFPDWYYVSMSKYLSNKAKNSFNTYHLCSIYEGRSPSRQWHNQRFCTGIVQISAIKVMIGPLMCQ